MRRAYAETEYARKRKNADSAYFLGLTNLLSILDWHMAGGEIEERARAAVRVLRARKGWTQGQLADAMRQHLPVDRQSWAKQANVSKYEIGTMDADVDTLYAFARALGVPFSRLIADQQVQPPTAGQVEAQAAAEILAALTPEDREPWVKLIRKLAPSAGKSGAAPSGQGQGATETAQRRQIRKR
jgi:transcriptional regulator with XRE-family HTH domain